MADFAIQPSDNPHATALTLATWIYLGAPSKTAKTGADIAKEICKIKNVLLGVEDGPQASDHLR